MSEALESQLSTSFFNTLSGPTDNGVGGNSIWIADLWMHFDAAGGFASIHMDSSTRLAFAQFITMVKDGDVASTHWIKYKKLSFCSDPIDYVRHGDVNILIGGESLMYVLNIKVELLEQLAQFIVDNDLVDEDEEVERN